MKISEVFKLIKQESGRSLKFIEKFSDGFRNDVFKVIDSESKEMLVLIVYKDEPRILKTINNAHDAAKFLGSHFPVRVPIEISRDKTILKIPAQPQQKNPQRYLTLYNFLEGESIPWELYKRRHLKSMGKILSNMHFILKDFKGRDLPDWKTEIFSEINSMKKYFKKVSPWVEKKLKISINRKQLKEFSNKFQNFLIKINKKNTYPIHYDFVRGNILFSNKVLEDDTFEITGILDFEKVCNGPHLADIARTLSFLIVDCKYKSETEVNKWFLQRGYLKRGKNKFKIDETELEILLQTFWLRDFYKFLLHNPYESLSENEHYLRTRDKLLERNLLTTLR